MNETGTRTDYPREDCIHDLLERVVERYADDTAVVFGGDRLSYRELNQRANRLAHHLQARGVGPEVLVGVCMERSADLYVAFLAILKAGGAYVPLDPSYPEDRLRMMVGDAGLRLILTKEGLLSNSSSDGLDIICLQRDAADLAQESDETPASRVGAQNLAYVMYTSGSTGKPKGVGVTHRAVCRLVRNTNFIEILPSDRIAQAANSAFDAATFEIWGALLNGAQIVGVSRDVILSPESLGRTLRDEGVTTLFLTTALFNQVAREAPQAFGALKHLLFGGEAVDPHWVRVVLEHGAPERLLHVYGPTENTTFSTWHLVEEVEEDAKTIPIGKPVSNSTMIVLDQDFQPVAAGATGELCLGGDGLARGYLERPELTAERFVSNPFGTEDGDRLYRTGDLVCLLPDGSVEFRGRVDHQVKIRGFRVEPGEIEVVLGGHPAVADTVAVARSDMPGDPSAGLGTGKQIVAYVVAEPSGGADAGVLRHFLKERLPHYMVPSAFVFLPELPLNVNGKVDRIALPAPTAEDLSTSRVFVEPKTHTEITLAGIWCEILGLPRVGSDDDFMELGGHSLHAARVLSRVAVVFQIDLPIYTLFENTRLSELAAEIETAQRTGEPTAGSSMKPVVRTEDLPLSFSQERVWFIQNMNPENRAYHFQAALRLHGKLDVKTLERSLSGIISRHEAFRTTFPERNSRPVQRIHDPEPVVLEVVDLTGQDRQEQDETVRHAITVEMQEPFDLEQLPLVRWKLFKLAEEEYSLGHVEHHLIHDGWSFNIFVRDLLDLYALYASDGPALPELPIQFADFAVWQREWMNSEAADEQRAFWARQLEGLPPMLNLPLDKPRPAVQGFTGGSFRREIPAELCDAVRAFSKAEGSTVFVPLLEALTILLHRYSGQDDVSIGCGIANRRWRETEDILGMIINNVVVRSDCSGQPTIHELMTRIRKTVLDAVAHQDLPFDSVVEAVQPERDLSYNPLFQVIFGLHDAPMPALEIPELSLEIAPGMSNGSAKFDLTLIAIPTSAQLPGYAPNADGDGMTMLWEYNSELFERSTVERMAAQYQLILEAIVSDSTQVVDSIPLMAEAEMSESVELWNDTERSYPRSKRVQELFEEQAERSPGAVALAHGEAEVTYRDLNEQANRLAHYLGRQGVAGGTPVAFMLERSPDTIVAMLAILKAGGVYVPLDVSYPKTRLAHMLDDSGATVVLTHEDLLGEAGDAIPSATRITCLDSEGPAIEKEATTNPNVDGGAEDLAYIMYTSGSTGKPKGVEIPHRAIARLLFGVDYVRLGPSQTILQMAPVSFDAATFEIWGALLNGGTCALFPSRVPGSDELREAIQQYGVNTMWLTASLFNFVVDEAPEVLAPVEQLLIGGEALSVSHVRRAYERLPATEIINGYGPTESTTFTCCYPIPRDFAEKDSSIPIGYPIANTTVYILDRHLQPLPSGVPGELAIGGDGLARGYRNDDRLTAERFVGDPFRDDPDSRLYKTGDLVRRLADGCIDFMGRLDDQVKLRGFRIELGEIEGALSAFDGVRAASVMLRDDPLGDGPSGSGSEKYLAAYVVPAVADAPPMEEDLRAFLKDELPEYMVPSAFVVLEEFPLTANGKIDGRALPVPHRGERATEETYTAPSTEIEETICDVWSEVLGVERVGTHDNFFDLGGNSLLMVQVKNRLRDRLNAELSIVNLFSHLTVNALAGLVAKSASETG